MALVDSSAASVAVVGAGAAGLVAAIFAASQGADVILIERTSDGGRKILISGGGRCNVIPSVLAPERFVTDSPVHVMRGMLKAWPLHQQRAFFEDDLQIPLAIEEESGKLFPASNRARDVRDGLVARARQLGAGLQFGSSVTGLEPNAQGWTIQTSSGDVSARTAIIATGGLSVPTTGSDGTGLAVAAALGHRMVRTYPALTPLLGGASFGHASLAGVSLNVRLRGRSGSRTLDTQGGFLFTHRGYSGPSVLDISHLVTREPVAESGAGVASGSGVVSGLSRTIRAHWSALEPADWDREFSAPSALISTILARHIPARLGEQLMIEAGVPPERRTSHLRRAERVSLVGRLTSYVLPWTGDEGYKKAEVTGGGVRLDEVDAKTLESKRCPGLYFCGEVLDAFGPIGGHNFAWAWATGRAAGLAAGQRAWRAAR